VPYYKDGGKNMFQVGESSCFGVWKDTKNKEAALQLLDYIATKNVIPELCETEGSVPGLSGISYGDSYATEAYYTSIKQFESNLIYDNVFDRQYFPSGMWNVMSEATTEIALDPSKEGVKSAVSLLGENFNDNMKKLIPVIKRCF
jgi:raffinose/stachyose/melibiose transport system substrate-binding protein